MAISFSQSPFESLSPELRERVESLVERRLFRKGEYLYQQGMPHDGLFWIRSGVVLGYRTKANDEYEMAAPITRGIWAGPSLVIDEHSVSMRAMTKCEVDWIAPENSAPLSKEPEFAALISHWCAEDFSLTISGTAAINKTRAEDKILAFIRQTIKLAGQDPEVDVDTLTGELPWPFSIVQLAEFTQLSRPHVSKVMTKLVAEGRIVMKDKALKLLY